MKAVIGILLIGLGFAIDYLVITNKLPPPGGIQPFIQGNNNLSLPTASNTSTSFAATSGQGSSGTGTPVVTSQNVNYNGPRAGRPF